MKTLRKSFLLAVCAAALFHVGACANAPADDEEDPQLTADDVAALPSDTSDPDHADLAALLAAEVPQDDGETFDTSDVSAFVDEPVVDDDDATTINNEVELDTARPVVAYAAPLLHSGLHPRASAALRAAGVPAWRITQTIGNAPASAGTHAKDGTVNGHAYCAATDISVHGLSTTQIKHLLDRLASVGFAAWYRNPGHDHWPASDARHIHAVYANAKMKKSLRSQVRSWLVGRNGLLSNAVYGFHKWSATAKSIVRHKFAQSDEGLTNAGSTCYVGGDYCGGDKITGNHNTLYRCTGTGAPTVERHCANGCEVRTAQNDTCR